MISRQITQISIESLAKEFFLQSEGRWRSQRRSYPLRQDVEPQEIVNLLTVRFLSQGSPELIELAKFHQLEENALLCGNLVTWEGTHAQKSRKPSIGSTVFGVLGDTLYRDRGFARKAPITAKYYFTNPTTMCIRTEDEKAVFEEELKLIGSLYRTRQRIISRAGEGIMVGQDLEKRLS